MPVNPAVRFWFAILALVLGHPVLMRAQSPAKGPEGVTVRDSVPDRRDPRDSAVSPVILSYPLSRPWQASVLTDTERQTWHDFDPLDPVRTGQEYGRLNNIGTAAMPLFPGVRTRIGFEAGFRSFDPYLLDADSLVMYTAPLAYTDIAYSQGPTSEDGIFSGTLARRFGKGTDFRIETLRIYNFGEYNRLANHHSSLRAGLRYVHPGGKYALLLAHGNHIIDQEENGGIRTDTLLGNENYSQPVTIPVFLTSAETRYRLTDYQLGQSLALAGRIDRDSFGQLVLWHKIRWEDRSFRFSDPDPSSDSLFYGDFQTDQRGIRQYTTWTTLTNTAGLLASWQAPSGSAIRFQGGLSHRLNRWDNEVHEGTVHNLILLGDLDMHWRTNLALTGRTQIGLGDQAGSWLLDGRLDLKAGRWARLNAGLLLSQRFPDLLAQELVVSQRVVYQHDWAKIQTQSLDGQLDLGILGLSAGGRLALVTHALVWRDGGLPDQIDPTVSLSQFWLRHHWALWRFHLENRVTFYHSSSPDDIRMPAWVSRHRLAYDDKWFRHTLRAQIGLEARLIQAWTPYGYQPLTGVFTLQSGDIQPFFPQLDGYLALERLGFRAYLQFENLGRSLFGWRATASNGADIPRLFSTVAGYPQPEVWIRWGIAFTFRG